jgi:hypothetical protein
MTPSTSQLRRTPLEGIQLLVVVAMIGVPIDPLVAAV